MTHRSRSGGPAKTHRKRGQAGQGRKLHHPPTAQSSSSALADNPEEDERSDVEEEDEVDPPLPTSAFADPTDADILAVIHRALRSTLDAPDFLVSVQNVKSLLYEKKWLEVFTNPAMLDVYAGRWVPSRAVCYRDLLVSLKAVRAVFSAGASHRGTDTQEDGEEDEEDVEQDGQLDGNSEEQLQAGSSNSPGPEAAPTDILSLGGGAGSELLAIAAMVQSLSLTQTPDRKGKTPSYRFTSVDIGPWRSTLDKLSEAVQVDWDIPLSINHIEGDLLGPSSADSTPIDLADVLRGRRPSLTTLFFTLTELMSQSRPATIRLLRQLSLLPSGSLLLVADSASDISEFSLGEGGRKWPVYMILDAILLGPAALKGGAGTAGSGDGDWELVRKEDSRWYRLPEGVGSGWPVKLENTRYWYRLYRRR